MAKVKPITPAEASAQRMVVIPPAVIKAWNELILRHYGIRNELLRERIASAQEVERVKRLVREILGETKKP